MGREGVDWKALFLVRHGGSIMRRYSIIVISLFAILLGGCNFPSPGTKEAPPPTDTSIPPLPADTPEPSPEPTQEPEGPEPGDVPEEAILILEPGAGSRLTSPIHVSGIADPTFEQNLIIRILLVDGTELALQPATIGADLGERGPFEVEIPLTIAEEQNALIQVYDQSARDGGIIHLASVGVMLAPGGPEDISSANPHSEDVYIIQPQIGEVVSGGVVHVEGFGIASFEGTLVVQVYDAEGTLVGSQPLIVNSPEMGVPGPFSADVSYVVGEEGPGRIEVMDPLPVFDGISHIASVEVILGP
jgi:hypothetical protein